MGTSPILGFHRASLQRYEVELGEYTSKEELRMNRDEPRTQAEHQNPKPQKSKAKIEAE